MAAVATKDSVQLNWMQLTSLGSLRSVADRFRGSRSVPAVQFSPRQPSRYRQFSPCQPSWHSPFDRFPTPIPQSVRQAPYAPTSPARMAARRTRPTARRRLRDVSGCRSSRRNSTPARTRTKARFATGTVGGRVGGKDATGGKVAASLPLAAWWQSGGTALSGTVAAWQHGGMAAKWRQSWRQSGGMAAWRHGGKAAAKRTLHRDSAVEHPDAQL
eukprot:gene12474-biopygen11172